MARVEGTEAFHPDAVMLDTLSPGFIVRKLISDNYKAVAAVEACAPHIALLAERVAQSIRKGGRLIYVGAGTSGRLAMLDAVECVPTFGISEGVVVAVLAGGINAFEQAREGAEDDVDSARHAIQDLKLTQNDIVCGIAASGTTPFVYAALAHAEEVGAFTVMVKNSDAELLVPPNMTIHLDTGPEIISGSTRLKAGTAQTIFCKTLTTTVFTLLGHTYGGLMVDVRATNKKLKKRAVRIVQLLTGLQEGVARIMFRAHGNSVKKAVVSAVKQVPAEEAERLLKERGGHLRPIIGDIDYTKAEVKE